MCVEYFLYSILKVLFCKCSISKATILLCQRKTMEGELFNWEKSPTRLPHLLFFCAQGYITNSYPCFLDVIEVNRRSIFYQHWWFLLSVEVGHFWNPPWPWRITWLIERMRKLIGSLKVLNTPIYIDETPGIFFSLQRCR